MRLPQAITSWLNRRHWERRWAADKYQPGWLEKGPRDQVKSAVKDGWLVAGKRLLDVGCGLGYTAAWLADVGFHVTAVDFARPAIEKAQKLFPATKNLEFDVVDVTQPWKPTGKFECVLDLGCIHQLDDDEKVQKYVRNLEKWTVPQCRLLFLMRTRSHKAQDPAKARTDWLMKQLGPNFRLDSYCAVNMSGSEDPKPRPGVAVRVERI